MNYYNEPFEILLPAVGQNGDNIFPRVTFMGDVSLNAFEAVGAIEDALTLVGQNLAEFAASETFETDMQAVFGKSADIEALLGNGELAGITVVPEELMNGANAGYDPLTGEVYLADAVVEQPANLVDVITEELGHYIDSEINEFDTTGDEGEYFAVLVSGDELSVEEIERLRGEDDSVEILDGLVVVEANEEVSFSVAGGFPVLGYGPYSVAVGEFNGDGILDLATANVSSGNVSVLLGNGDGSFTNATSFDVGDKPRSVAVGEFNGDGISDLAVANELSDNVSVLLGLGDGGFSNATNFDVGDNPRSVVVGEFNGDGISDLAVANRDSDNVSVLLGFGDGSFSNVTNFDAGDGPFSVAVGEFNDDGVSDLAVANISSDNVSLLLGNGDGSFSNAFNVRDGSRSVTVAEFNGDGISDLAVADWSSGNVSVLLGKGDGSFSNATNFDVGAAPYSVAVGEFNGDGISDLAVSRFAVNDVSVLLGNGDGSFNSAINFYAGVTSNPMAIEDFNGDGLQDLAVGLEVPGRVSILLNTTPIPPNITISNTKITEGNKGRKNAKFTVTLDGESDETVKVNYATADGTAKSGKDYRKTTGTLTFKPGQTQKTVTVPVLGDTIDETNENFRVTLSEPTNAKLRGKRGTATIRDNDKPPKLSVGNETFTEGQKGSKNISFEIVLDNRSEKTVTVNYATADGTAKAKKDYQPASDTVGFQPGQTRKIVTIPIVNDTIDEPNEKFTVNLSKPQNAQLKDKRGVATIRDNDKPPAISIGNQTITEGNKGRKNAKFTVTLDEASEKTVKVNYTTADGTAKSGQDYRKTTGTLTFKPGQTKKTITVPILGDNRDESNEKFNLNLSKPKNAKLGDKRGVGTIRDND